MSQQIIVGKLQVDLEVNTATFTADLNKIKGGLTDVGTAGKKAGDDLGKSMTEARGGLMLTDEVLGISIPRHLQALIVQIPGVATLFANMLPIIGVAAAIAVIGEIIEKHQKHKEALEQVAHSWQAVDDISTKGLQSISTQITQTQKTIDTLNHNYVAALADGLRLIDQQSFSNLIQQVDALSRQVATAFADMAKEIGFFDKMNNFIFGLDAPSKAANKDFQDWVTSWKSGGAQLDELTDKITRLQDEQEKIKNPTAVTKQVHVGRGPGTVSETTTPAVNEDALAANQKEISSFLALKAAKEAADAAKDTSDKAVKLQAYNDALTRTIQLLTAQAGAQKLLSDANANFNNEVVKGTEQAEMSALDAAIDSNVKRHLLDESLYDEKKVLINQDTSAEQDHYQQLYEIANTDMQKRLADLKKDPTKNVAAITTLNAQIQAAAIDNQTKLLQINQQGSAKIAAVDQAEADARISINQRAMEQLKQLAQEDAKFNQQNDALKMASAKSTADFEYQLGAKTAQQHIADLKDQAAQELTLEKKSNADLLAETAANDPAYPVTYQKYLDANTLAQQKYNNQIVKLDQDAIAVRKQAWDAGFSAMNQGMSSLVSDMFNANASITDDVKKMLESMLTSWINYFLQIRLQAIETAAFTKIFGIAASATGGGGIAGVDTTNIPGLAGGGTFSPNMPILVGENGPEIMTPGVSGSITPLKPGGSSSGGGGGATVNNYINASNAQSPAEVEQRINLAIAKARPGIVRDAVKAGQDQNKRR